MDKKYLPAEVAQQSHQQPGEALKTDYNFYNHCLSPRTMCLLTLWLLSASSTIATAINQYNLKRFKA
jgi:hypothetical protein